MIIIGNLFGLLDSVFFATSSFRKDFNQILKFHLISNFFAILSCIFLGGFTGAITVSIIFIRNILRYFKLNRKWTTAVVVIAQSLVVFLFNTEGLWGILPFLATVPYTIIQARTESKKTICLLLIYNSIIWGIYFLHILNYVSFCFSFISILICIYNFKKESKRDENLETCV